MHLAGGGGPPIDLRSRALLHGMANSLTRDLPGEVRARLGRVLNFSKNGRAGCGLLRSSPDTGRGTNAGSRGFLMTVRMGAGAVGAVQRAQAKGCLGTREEQYE